MPGKPSMDRPVDGQTPLIKFRGRFVDYDMSEREFEATADRGARKQTSVKFDFDELEVLETREPYPLPIATITIPFSDRANTRWAAWVESAVKWDPTRDIDNLKGKRQEWTWAPAMLRQTVKDDNGEEVTPQKWANQLGECWQVTWVEGVSPSDGASFTDKLLTMADGKTDDLFYQAVFANAEIKSHPDYMKTVEAISQRTLLSGFESLGLLKKTPEGTWAKV